MVSLTREPYAYVGDNPLNGKDPSSLIDPNSLSADQRQQIQDACGTWQNQSLCRQAAFCTGDACHTIAQIAIDDNNLVAAALRNSLCGDVTLKGGYQATHAEAERDLAETYQAFYAATQTIAKENSTHAMRVQVLQACGVAGLLWLRNGFWGAASGCVGAA